jgi:hypothetical protein
MNRGFFDLLDLSNDPEFFWQVISGPPCIFFFVNLFCNVNLLVNELKFSTLPATGDYAIWSTGIPDYINKKV